MAMKLDPRPLHIPMPFSIEGGHVTLTPHVHTLGFGTHEGSPAPPNPMNPHFGSGVASPAAVVGALQGGLQQAALRVARPLPQAQAFRLPGNTQAHPFRAIADRLTGKA